MITLTPAYGRDYRSKAEAIADFDAGKDFTLNDMESPYDGKPINKEQVVRSYAGQRVQIRFRQLRSVTTVKIQENTAERP